MITLFMEMWCAFWSWVTGEVEEGNQFKVWDILWTSNGEWYDRPAGQHREGLTFQQVMREVKLRDLHAQRLQSSERYRLVAAA